MKDLITTIGALMILMMFVVQFANNQSIATRILAADHYADMYEEEKPVKPEFIIVIPESTPRTRTEPS